MSAVTDTKTEAPSMSAEQTADLAALQASAAGAPPVPGTEPISEPPRPDLAQEITGLVTVAVTVLEPMFPSLKATYTQEVTQAAAQAIAGVCNKRGWMQGGMMGEWGEEIACAAIVGPLAFSTWQGIRADLEARAKAAKKTEAITVQSGPDLSAPAPTQQAGSNTVSFGTPA